ncbi:MAG: RagB/SusD family nutrient uptake outer membrane protein [Chitinophaga sp.]|jgi:starch-binding outer membrane protein, SusD/RagB family|nr:RagB/SusD family nutrient uptake outer membrane protein [Chitinophaga sp.]
MKLIKIFFSIAVVASIATGCKQVLDTSPNNSISDASAFATADRCLLVLNGVYDAAQSGFYNGSYSANRGYPFGAANIEQGDNRGEDVVNIAAFYQITYQGTYNPTTANNVNMWANLYGLINRCNIAIDGFAKASGGVLTAPVASQYIAECRFLRAMAHHEALIHFARPYTDNAGKNVGVPYRDFPVNSGTAVDQITTTPRMRVDSVYIKILADLDFAEANLPAAANVARVSKAVAIAMKMRVKLHQADFAGVITEGAKLVPATVNPLTPASVVSPIGGYALTANPDGPFANNVSNTESMFSIRNDALDNAGVNAALSTMYGSVTLTGRGLVAVSPVIWNNAGWQCDDKRRTLLYVTGTNGNGSQSYFTTKYRDYANRADYAPQFRYAEVLLTLAEAEARNAVGVSQRAIDLLNVVRNRSLASPLTSQYTLASFATKVDLTKAILLERRIEFLCEGKRWADIHRNAPDATYTTGGIPAKAVNGAAGLSIYNCGAGYTPGQALIPYNDYRFIWPIPTDEISANPIISQNPGY